VPDVDGRKADPPTPASPWAARVGEGLAKPRPVDLVGQPHQRVLGVGDLVEVGLEQVKRIGGLGFGLHGFRCEIARF